MRRWIGLGAVAAAAVAIIVFHPRLVETPAPSAQDVRKTDLRTDAVCPELLLIANPAEAHESCGCGEIIRMVRGAAARGATVRELAPGAAPELERRYRVTVAPTLLCLDDRGREIARYEGESPAVVESVRTRLARLSPAR